MTPKDQPPPPDWDVIPGSGDYDPGNIVWPVSTTWRTRRGKIARAPQATQDSDPKGHRLMRMPRRNPRDPLTVVLKYRGGAMGWVEIRSRGAIVRVPGDTDILSLVLLLNSQA